MKLEILTLVGFKQRFSKPPSFQMCEKNVTILHIVRKEDNPVWSQEEK